MVNVMDKTLPNDKPTLAPHQVLLTCLRIFERHKIPKGPHTAGNDR